MILKFFKWIFKLFGYKIISIRDYDNQIKVNRLLTEKYQDDIRTLVFEPDSHKAKEIIAVKQMERDHERLMWFGFTEIPHDKLNSIINPPETT